jgi:phosphoglycerate dehydrogenase-like enzyme
MVAPAEIEKLGGRPAALEELLQQADVLTLHCPSTAQTRGMINQKTLSQMKQGAILINVSRGDLVEPEALTSSLASGQLGAAALDVFNPEPIPAGHPLLSMQNVILAPHIASCSVPAVKKLRESAANIALAAVRGEALGTIVNGVKR